MYPGFRGAEIVFHKGILAIPAFRLEKSKAESIADKVEEAVKEHKSDDSDSERDD